jgi:ABC-type uncharacterized transport system auxiliary subunit
VTFATVALLVAGCVSLPGLPGSDKVPPRRYLLQPAVDQCTAGDRAISLSIVKVGAGLNTDRVARRDARTGAFTFLKDVRWVDRTAAMLEQRLAEDLECRGFVVVTSHHSRLDHDQLVCEARAMNLVADAGRDRAEVSLSCLLFRDAASELAIQAAGSSDLSSWSADAAANAMSSAYRRAFEEMLAGLPGASP